MCKVSNKLKLCTCVTPQEKLKHFWAFHRYVEDKELLIMGMPYFPDEFSLVDHESNKEILEILLNEDDVFDVKIKPKAKDRLEFFFSFTEFETASNITYGFEFRKGKWKSIEYDYFDYENNYDQENYGKITNALERIIENN